MQNIYSWRSATDEHSAQNYAREILLTSKVFQDPAEVQVDDPFFWRSTVHSAKFRQIHAHRIPLLHRSPPLCTPLGQLQCNPCASVLPVNFSPAASEQYNNIRIQTKPCMCR